LKAIRDYENVGMGPGYIKLLKIRLHLINQRLESTKISNRERGELEAQKDKIEDIILKSGNRVD
jgi:hypothetical protein